MNHQQDRSNDGFTLIEIMVTLTIIGLLAGMLFGGVRRAKITTKRASASGTAYNLRNAIASYYTKYRRLPVTGSAGDEFIDLKSDETIMDILLGSSTNIGIDKSPRSIVFFLGKPAKRLDSDRFINGVRREKDGRGTLWDPFGRLYGIRLDVGNRGSIPNPAVNPPNLAGGSESPRWGKASVNADTPDILSDSVVVWSSGKDVDLATDNITTW